MCWEWTSSSSEPHQRRLYLFMWRKLMSSHIRHALGRSQTSCTLVSTSNWMVWGYLLRTKWPQGRRTLPRRYMITSWLKGSGSPMESHLFGCLYDHVILILFKYNSSIIASSIWVKEVLILLVAYRDRNRQWWAFWEEEDASILLLVVASCLRRFTKDVIEFIIKLWVVVACFYKTFTYTFVFLFRSIWYTIKPTGKLT